MFRDSLLVCGFVDSLVCGFLGLWVSWFVGFFVCLWVCWFGGIVEQTQLLIVFGIIGSPEKDRFV